MDSVQIQNKIRLLFSKMSEPGYIMNNYYADGLINKLAHGTEPEIVQLKSLNLLQELVIEALGHEGNVHNTVLVFIIRLLAIVTAKEKQFTKILSKRGDEISKGFKDINSQNMNPSLRVAYMEVALALLCHDSGMSWLLETGVWKEILSLCNEKQTVFVVRQTYKFATKFIWNLNDMGDESNLKLIFGHILKPLENDLVNKDSIVAEEEEVFSKTLEPVLQILLSVLTEVERIIKPNIVINIITKEFGVSCQCYVIFDRLRKVNITLLTSKVLFWIMIAKVLVMKPPVPGTVYSSDEFVELVVTYFNTVNALIQRRWPTTILDFCNACNMIWLSVSKNNRIQFDSNSVNLNNQLLFMCLMPTFLYIKEYGKKFESSAEDRMAEYITKLLNKNCEHTARAGYGLRDLMMKMDVISITMQSVKRLTCLKNHLNTEQANAVFQALFYILVEYDPTMHTEPSSEDFDYEGNQDKIVVMSFVLDTVLYLVKNHDINWHESVEVVCLYNIVYNILKRPNLSSRFIVTALNVIAVTVKKFLPPNLSLLLETKPGSSMHELGKLIYMKLHDLNWEIRDSALELLLVCTEISFVKFPPFQKQIIENNLINVAATIAFNDHEFYVQASALKCLGTATKINSIWEHLRTQYPDIQDRLIGILRNNQEGIVRKEACSALCKLYQNIKINSSFKNTLYEHMVSSALTDFHWEVQLGALKFWRMVIQSLLNDQGMLDGTFPPVTFSRESRKIVTLNDNEIQKRLLRILDELASIGCLTVLVKLLQEDIDVDIMDAALSISLDLINILDQYKVPEIIKYKAGDVSHVDELISDSKEEDKKDDDEEMAEAKATPKADTVIEGILNADDMNLLANIYERRLNLQPNEPKPCIPKVKLLKSATPYLFVNHLKNKDFKAVVEENKKWKEGIRSISSLLDDVLGIYELDEEVNTLDCY